MTTNTDRELLELAAKAFWGDQIDDVCLVRWLDADEAIGYTYGENQDHNGQDVELVWNPLDDDGDALRLSCCLEIDLAYRVVSQIRVEALAPGGPRIVEVYDQSNGRSAATRRAIVRVAAAIGKAMP